MAHDGEHLLAAEVQRLLSLLVTVALVQDEEHAASARAAAGKVHAGLQTRAGAGDGLQLEGLWTVAIKEAETPELGREALRTSPTLPAACPFTIAELTGPTLDVDALAGRIRATASTG